MKPTIKKTTAEELYQQLRDVITNIEDIDVQDIYTAAINFTADVIASTGAIDGSTDRLFDLTVPELKRVVDSRVALINESSVTRQ